MEYFRDFAYVISLCRCSQVSVHVVSAIVDPEGYIKLCLEIGIGSLRWETPPAATRARYSEYSVPCQAAAWSG